MDNRAIGVFDSGFGGLTVTSEIIHCMPNESIIYFGDGGRAPYGTKSTETVLNFTFQDINFLLSQNVKMIVIACNTASACSLHHVINRYNDIPIIDVINPGATAAIKHTKNKKIGVIGTSTTIGSKAYEIAIKQVDLDAEIFSIACPLFVPLAEEGWWDNDIAFAIAKKYLEPLKILQVDTLVLGCTHYPLLQTTISNVVSKNIAIINPAFEVVNTMKKLMSKSDIYASADSVPLYKYYTSDSVSKFKALGSSILGHELDFVEKISIENF